MSTRTLRSAATVDVDVKPDTHKYLSLSKEHRAELEAIWTDNPRVPTLESRIAWAEARCIEPTLVKNWFPRKLSRWKTQGRSVPGGSYELDPGPAGNQTSAPPLNAAGQVKRERLSSPILLQPRTKRCKTNALAGTISSKPREVKAENEAQMFITVRHTRRHDANPHPTCLTCSLAYAFPEDLPPSSPPPSSPPETPPLTFSSDSLSSDARFCSPLTPVASDDEEADIEAYLVSSSSNAGRTRIYAPIRKPVLRSAKHSMLQDAYTDSQGAEGPSMTTLDDTEEILSFSPSPCPEPVSPHRKKRKRVTFSDETITFVVDPLRSFHRFSFEFGLDEEAKSLAQDHDKLSASALKSAASATAPGSSPVSTAGAPESSATDHAAMSKPGLTTPSSSLSPPARTLNAPTSPLVDSVSICTDATPGIASDSLFPQFASASARPSLKPRLPPLRVPTPATSVVHPYDGHDKLLVRDGQSIAPASLHHDASIVNGPIAHVISAMRSRMSVVTTSVEEVEVVSAVKPKIEASEVVCIPGETYCDVRP